MATRHDNGFRPNLEMLHSVSKNQVFPRTTIARPLSNATEIFDTDFESDYDDEFDSSPRRSAGSLVADSVTTASTPRDIPTPDSAALSSFHFHLADHPVLGPSGPHLFRSSVVSDSYDSTYEVDLILAKTPTTAVFDKSSILQPQRKDTPLPDYLAESSPEEQINSINAAVSTLDEAEVRSWSPPDVVRWMQQAGFDDSVIEKFFINDISGAILLELQADDLKELDIRSFGKRRRLMDSIQHLRDSVMVSAVENLTPLATTSQNEEVRCTTQTRESSSTSTSSSDCSSDKDNKKEHIKKQRRHRHDRTNKHNGTTMKDLPAGERDSIVAIEQVLPKPHYCSKGEACRKWQKQQRKIVRLAKDLPIDITAASQYHPQPGHRNQPLTSKSLPGTEPMLTPSIVASSDVLGPEQTSHFRLSEEKLNALRQQDPQENVRQFLSFQHLRPLQTVNDPRPTQAEFYSSPGIDSPDSTKTTASLAENLRTLPKLTIPVTQLSAMSTNHSAQRTVTPSILRNRPKFTSASIDSALHSTQQQPYTYGQDISPVDYYGSPSDFYRSHELYRETTPFSEVDVPVTAIPAGPIARDISQSVPPDMRYGHILPIPVEPINRPGSTKAENYRRRPSFSTSNMQVLDRVDEVVAPIDTIEDLNKVNVTPRATPGPPGDAVHSGWMKKRKTTRLLRHEWEDHHFTLKGTQLAMFDDEDTSHRDSKALEYIDVDDYAVACSSFASSSKLTAAFKKTVLKRKESAHDEAAFAFSLIPAPNGVSTATERKAFFMNSGKSHHFAVKTRDERIDWMRELMLAKALKRGKESGDAVNLNGQWF